MADISRYFTLLLVSLVSQYGSKLGGAGGNWHQPETGYWSGYRLTVSRRIIFQSAVIQIVVLFSTVFGDIDLCQAPEQAGNQSN